MRIRPYGQRFENFTRISCKNKSAAAEKPDAFYKQYLSQIQVLALVV
jgi:hypothetical protein